MAQSKGKPAPSCHPVRNLLAIAVKLKEGGLGMFHATSAKKNAAIAKAIMQRQK